jgi:hypothetical protein
MTNASDIEMAVSSVFEEERGDLEMLRRLSGDNGDGCESKETIESKYPEDIDLPNSENKIAVSRCFRRCNMYILFVPLGAFLLASVVNDVVSSFNANSRINASTVIRHPMPSHELAALKEHCHCENSTENEALQTSTIIPDSNSNVFVDGKVAVEELLKTLDVYYNGYGVLQDSFALNWNSSAFSAGMNRLSDKFARAIVWKEPFVVGTIGSSVTAGHDNCAFDSYQNQLQRTIQPILSILGSGIEVRNAGQGGNCGDSHENQIWCLRTLVGDDVDTVHYSWTYFEHSDSQKYHEMFTRWTLLMEKTPVPLILNTGEGASVNVGNNRLLREYASLGYNELFMQRGLRAHVPNYPGKVWGRVGDGLHNTTRYGAVLDDLERRNSLGVEFRNWHPGPLLFQTVADSLALQYSIAIHTAITNIENILQRGDEPKIMWPHKTTLLSISDLPVPEQYPFSTIAETPSCSNFELPTFGLGQINILNSIDQFNDEFTHYNNTRANFKLWKAKASTLIPRSERHLPQCQHADYCRGYRKDASVDTNPITFRLPRMNVGFVAFCGMGKESAKNMILQNVTVWLDTVDVSSHLKQIFGKCVQVQKSFTNSVNAVDGHITLAIQFPALSDTFTITHVITA